MPDNSGSVGSITLDLNVNDKVTAQIEKIANAAKGPAERIGKELEHSVEAPMRNIGGAASQVLTKALTKSVGSATGAIIRKMNELSTMIREKLGALEFPTENTERFSGQLENVNSKLSLMQKTWQELVNTDPLSGAAEKVAQLEKKVAALEKKLSELTAVPKKVPTKLPVTTLTTPSAPSSRTAPTIPNIPSTPRAHGTPGTRSDRELGASDVVNGLSGGASGIAGLIGTVVSGNPAVGAAVGSATSSILGTVSKSFGTVTRLINKLTGNAVARLKNLGSNLLDITKPLRKLGNMLTRAFKSVFIASALYGAFRALKDGIIEAANADEQFSKSLNEVKANLAIAFTPIILHVLPILDEMMAKLAATSKQVATFMAGLFGMTYKQAADARKKLDDTIKTAKKAKNAIAGIDELNILGSDEEENSGIDYSKLDMSDAKLPDWAERLKDAIKRGDWDSVGRLLAGKVNGVLADIDWENIENKLKGKLKNLTKLINGFVKGIDPKTIGKTLAGVVNTVTGSINTLVDGIDWGLIGAKLAQSLNSAVERIDWNALGRTLTSGLRIAIEVLYNFSKLFNWGKLGVKLGEAFNSAVSSIDTEKLAK
ncbi:MAG: hypothetical protein Q4A05_10790, partial [Ruminococcus sp.]|nr:hypothetical protein [Ruminococcus sp.]